MAILPLSVCVEKLLFMLLTSFAFLNSYLILWLMESAWIQLDYLPLLHSLKHLLN